jgi:hypothetical protein
MANGNTDGKVFDLMAAVDDATGIDFSKIGENITDLTVEQISKLPLEQRKKAVSRLGEKAPDWMLKSLFGENWLGAKLMARYVGGSGEDYHLDMSESSWKDLISIAKDEADIVGGWTPSTNRDFPSEEGWEYVSGVQSGLMQEEYGDIYNALGETAIRRRPVGRGKYEYQIAGETFDFVEGEKGKGGQIYGEYNTRTVSDKGAKIINDLFPEHTYASEVYYNNQRVNVSSEQSMVDFGTPFRIKSSYIGE